MSASKTIIKTATITFISLIVLCVVVMSVVFFCFPLKGYEFFSDIGFNRSALFFAERYADIGHIDGLVYCVDLSDNLLSESGDEKYAKKLKAYTEDFFEYDNIYEYIEQIDEYYIKSSEPIYRVGVYSYYAHLVSLNYKARTVLNDYDSMFLGKEVNINDIGFEDHSVTAVVLLSMSEQLRNGKTCCINGTSFSDVYYNLKSAIPQYIADIENCTDKLTSLYRLRALIYFVDEIKMYLQANEMYDSYWDGVLSFKINGLPLKEAYTAMLKNYIAAN